MATKRWQDLSERQRGLLLTLISTELALTATAAVDLARRPSHEVRGGRKLWWLLIFVQPIGPLAYLFWARRRQ